MNERRHPTVAVIGAGITGLTAAYTIKKESPDTHVRLFEAYAPGGVISTLEFAGVPVDQGPDWFVTRNPAAVDLCRELGLEGELVAPRKVGTFIWRRGRLRKLPPAVRGIPISPRAAWRLGLLSPMGTFRAYSELLRRKPLVGPDVSIGSFVRRRFGSEVLERMVDPLLAGSRSGTADEMSLSVAAPELDAAARAGGSVLKQLRRMTSEPVQESAFLGLRTGMRQLVIELLDRLDSSFEGPAVGIEDTVDGGYIVTSQNPYEEPVRHVVDAAILAIPPFEAARVIDRMSPPAAKLLRKIPFVDGHVVTLLYPPGTPIPEEGSGLLVPSKERRNITACAWYSEKWDHARPDDGSVILRCFVKSTPPIIPADVRQRFILKLAAELDEILGLSNRPTEWHIQYWKDRLPVFQVGHGELITTAEEALSPYAGVQMVGAGYRGSGLPDCITDGRRAAQAVLAHLSGNPS